MRRSRRHASSAPRTTRSWSGDGTPASTQPTSRALGATGVGYEGVPALPDPGRPWRIAERLGVTIVHPAPTTIRMLRKLGPDEPKKYDYRFKHMTTVGEPIEPDVWRWYHDVVGKSEAGGGGPRGRAGDGG